MLGSFGHYLLGRASGSMVNNIYNFAIIITFTFDVITTFFSHLFLPFIGGRRLTIKYYLVTEFLTI